MSSEPNHFYNAELDKMDHIGYCGKEGFVDPDLTKVNCGKCLNLIFGDLMIAFFRKVFIWSD